MDWTIPPDVLQAEVAKMQPAAIVCNDDPDRIPRWVALIGSNLADAVTTTIALRRPNVYEANPLMGPIAKKPVLLWSLKGGIGVFEAWVLDKTTRKLRGRCGVANWATAVLSGANVALTISNYRNAVRR